MFSKEQKQSCECIRRMNIRKKPYETTYIKKMKPGLALPSTGERNRCWLARKKRKNKHRMFALLLTSENSYVILLLFNYFNVMCYCSLMYGKYSLLPTLSFSYASDVHRTEHWNQLVKALRLPKDNVLTAPLHDLLANKREVVQNGNRRQPALSEV